MIRSHQPGAQPVEIPESIPNPAALPNTPTPTPTPTKAPKPAKVPEPAKPADANVALNSGRLMSAAAEVLPGGSPGSHLKGT